VAKAGKYKALVWLKDNKRGTFGKVMEVDLKLPDPK
jgi:hypothetical protein